jgi:hypothetical protein
MWVDPSDPACNKPNNDLYNKGRRDSRCIAGRVQRDNADPLLFKFARELSTAHIESLSHDGTPQELQAISFHAGGMKELPG